MTPDIPDDVRARDLIGHGSEPPQCGWPGGATVAVNLVVVYEEGSEVSVLWGDERNEGWGEYAGEGPQPPRHDLGNEGHYEYGSRAGIWRLARIIDEAGVPATISATATALELNPAVATWMNDREHDLLGHGWRWLPPWSMDESTEREHLGYAIETYERVCGRRPLGWNSPYSASDATRRLLLDDGGFLYDSDPCSDDVPYYASCEGRQMLVVPYSKTYNDSRYLASPGFASPRDHLELLTMGLDQLVREQRTAMMTVAVHARWTGQAARAAALRAFLDHATKLSSVTFMRRDDIARWWLDMVPAG